MDSAIKLKKLRKLLSKHDLDGYYIPSTDSHFNEYVAAPDRLLEYISGFTGSSGHAIVTNDKALLWTDSRYYIQASNELSSDWLLMKQGMPGIHSPMKWIEATSMRIAVDPRLISFTDPHLRSFVLLTTNLIHDIWPDRPPIFYGPITHLPECYTGKPTKEKLADIRTLLRSRNRKAIFVSSLDTIAWITNCRGSDIKYNPLFFSYLLITLDAAYLFVPHNPLDPTVLAYLKDNGVVQLKYQNIPDILPDLLKDMGPHTILAQKSLNAWIADFLGKDQIDPEPYPLKAFQALKNYLELDGFREANLIDALAIVRYLCWLDSTVSIAVPITEYDGSLKLHEFRKKGLLYVDDSFETISSAGPNSAIVHYAPKPTNSRPITRDEIYLLDSGGQYLNGTTDTTRTIHLGTPTKEERLHFTLVLKGHIALSTVKFFEGVTDRDLDYLARQYLAAHGLVYRHATGHGVGHYLCVHESPPVIAPSTSSLTILTPGMVVTNEPGCYIEGSHGIRIESMMVVTLYNPPATLNNITFMEFETITYVPIQTKMILKAHLTDAEVKWVNDYNRNAISKLAVAMTQTDKNSGLLQWLEAHAAPL